MIKIFFFFFVFIWLSGMLLKAQGLGDMISDRPLRTESAISITRGVLQLETGFHYDGDREDLGVKMSYAKWNTSLLRLGISDNSELRFESGYSRLSYNNVTVSGMEPVKFGFKSQVAYSAGNSPDVAVIFGVSPGNLGSLGFKNENWEFELLWTFGWNLSKRMHLGSNIGIITDSKFTGFVIPVSTVFDFPFEYKFRGFFELYGELVKSEDPRISGSIGITYLQNSNLQFDVYIGKGINDAAYDWSSGFGLSWRFGPLFR